MNGFEKSDRFAGRSLARTYEVLERDVSAFREIRSPMKVPCVGFRCERFDHEILQRSVAQENIPRIVPIGTVW